MKQGWEIVFVLLFLVVVKVQWNKSFGLKNDLVHTKAPTTLNHFPRHITLCLKELEYFGMVIGITIYLDQQKPPPLDQHIYV